jgi:hypothetical protein
MRWVRGNDDPLGTILALVDVALPPTHRDGSPLGYVLQVLRKSRDFWDDDERDLIDPIWAEYEKQCDELAAHLTARWGGPSRVPLGPILDRIIAGEIVPPLPDELSQVGTHVDVWRVGDRVVCLGVGQYDNEFPVVIFAAVGDHWLAG